MVTWSLSLRTSSARRPASHSWKMRTWRRVSKWTCIAISVCSFAGRHPATIAHLTTTEPTRIPVRTQDVLVPQALLVVPEVVEPLDDPRLERKVHVPELHVLLHPVHPCQTTAPFYSSHHTRGQTRLTCSGTRSERRTYWKS